MLLGGAAALDGVHRRDPAMVRAAKKPAQAEHCKMPEELPGHGWSHGQAHLQTDWANREI